MVDVPEDSEYPGQAQGRPGKLQGAMVRVKCRVNVRRSVFESNEIEMSVVEG